MFKKITNPTNGGMVNAGILFYSTKNNETWFLLARESFLEGYKASGQWSAFEGGSQRDETPQQTAVRECFEESMGVIQSREVLEARIADPQTRSLKMIVTDGADQSIERHLFCLRIDKDEYEQVGKHFADVRKQMTDLESRIRTFNQLSDIACETGWPTVGRMNTCLGHKVMDVNHCHWDGTDHMYVHYIGLIDGRVRKQISGFQVTAENRKFVKSFMSMIRIWASIKTIVEQNSTPLIQPVVVDQLITTYLVKPDFMEKSELKWVPMEMLANCLRPSRKHFLTLRYKFAVAMSLILDHRNLLLRKSDDTG